MRKAAITDIRKRLKGLQYVSESNISTSPNTVFIKGAKSTAISGRIADVKRVLESMASSRQDIPFDVCMELFNAIISRGTLSDVQKMGSIICEDIVHKVRDAKHMQVVLKQRMSKAKSKLHNKAPENANDAVKGTLPQPINPSITEAAISAYESMLENAIIYMNCDRIIENYNRISRRFNIDKLFYENTRVNGVQDTVVELCQKIDTYNLPEDIKFNTVIETAFYGFEHNSIEYRKSDILEATIEYYLFKKDGKDACKNILENSVFFDKDDYMGDIDIITEEEPTEDCKPEDIKTTIESFCAKPESKISNISESTEFQDIFNKFKEDELEDKPESKLKSLVSKLYSRNVDSIVEGTPSLLSWIRRFFILSTGLFPVIGPIIMIVGFIADRFISLGMERKEVLNMVKAFNNEIVKTQAKLASTDDKETKERLEKYIKAIEDARDKLDQYHNDLITDEEMDKKYEDLELPSAKDKDNEFGFDFNMDDDFDFFEESTTLEKLVESVSELVELVNKQYIDKYDMKMLSSKLTDEDITSVAAIANEYPNVFHKKEFKEGIDLALKTIRGDRMLFESNYDKVMTISALQSAKAKLNEFTEPSEKVMTIYEALDYVENIKEAYEAINLIIANSNTSTLLEVSISNRLKMASMKLRNTFQKLKDKDRQLSKSVDLSLNNFKKGVERSLTNDNRESIIKGSILPSASKLIKLAIANAGLYFLMGPVAAVIGTLGYLGASAKFKAKERQMLTDEIEIELKMCRKYIEIAEQKNDMKALKQLLMIERDLSRQHQRIKYKMKAELGQKYYDAKSSEDH